MAIKTSDLIKSNIIISNDTSPSLGGNLNTAGFSISNGASPVNISGNNYPTTAGSPGYVMSTDGLGNLSFAPMTATGLELYSENFFNPITPVALGVNSVALGNGATASSVNSLAIGEQSLSRVPGSVMQANGRYSSTGDAQCGRYLLRNVTTSGLPVELFIDGVGGSVRLTIPDDSTWMFTANIVAHQTNGTGYAGFLYSGVITRGSGASTTIVRGTIQKTTVTNYNPLWGVVVEADATHGSLKILAHGSNSNTIRWLSLVETIEITN